MRVNDVYVLRRALEEQRSKVDKSVLVKPGPARDDADIEM